MKYDTEKRISFKAIIVGFIVDLGGTLITTTILGIIVGVIIGISQMKQGVPLNELENADFMRIVEDSHIFYFVYFLIALGYTFLGGWITGRIAKKAEILNSAIMGTLSLVSGLPFILIGDGFSWYSLIAAVFTLPVAILGGYTAYVRRKESR